MARDDESAHSDFSTVLASFRRGDTERPALSFYRGRAKAGELTYGELVRAVDQAAGHLASRWGIGRGDRVAILSHNRLEVPVLFLAAMKLGAVVVPLNPTAAPAEWDYVLSHAGVRLVFATASLSASLPPSTAPVVPLDVLLEQHGPPCASFAASGDEPAVVLYTSGTTANPKGVVLSRRSLLANAWAMAERLGTKGATQLAVLPLYHAHAFGFGLMTALTTGGHLVFQERFEPFSWSELIRAHGVSATSVVPTMLPALLSARVELRKIPTLAFLLVSSAPLDEAMGREFEARTRIPLVTGWGLSEFTNFACCMPRGLAGDVRREILFGGEWPSVGTPLPRVEIRVEGSDGRELGQGERGELCVRGPSAMTAYHDDAPATQAALNAEGWLRTGDLGFFVHHAGERFFFIAGRIKEIIVRDGAKVSPPAVERALLACVPELLGKLVVVGFPHRAHGEEVGAYLELDALSAPQDLVTRLLDAAEKMPVETRPKVIVLGRSPIPRTHTGKVQRRKLGALFAAHDLHRGAVVVVQAAGESNAPSASSTIR